MNKKEIMKGKFTIKSPANEINPLELMDASIKTGVPIVFAGDRISNFELKKNGKIIDISDLTGIKDLEIGGIKIIPGNIIPLKLRIKNTDCIFNNCLFRGKKIRNKLKISTEDRNYPYKFEFHIDNENPSGDFTINLDSKANLKQIFNWEKFIRTLNKKQTLELINPKNEKQVYIFNISDLNAGNDNWYNLLKKLMKIQEATGHEIKLPEDFKVTQEDENNINTAFNIINGEKIKIENMGMVTNAITAKNMMDERKEILIEFHEDFILKIFEERIKFGTFEIQFNKYKFLDEYETQIMLKDTSDNDLVRIRLKPLNEVISFNDYTKTNN